VILIVLVPTAIFIIQAQKAVSAEHLRAEAINVATRQLETLQLEAAQGTLPTGSSSVTYPVAEAGSRVTKFKVKPVGLSSPKAPISRSVPRTRMWPSRSGS
jgi:hypothetical protein